MTYGRIVAVAILGFFFMFFLAVDLVLFGVLALNSVLVTILPLVGLVGGAALGFAARKRQPATVAAE